MRFSLKLALVMTGVIVLALLLISIGAGSVVREAYVAALRNTLAAHVERIDAMYALRLTQSREEMRRLIRLPRLVAALGTGEEETLVQVAEDELRSALESGGAGSTFLFFNEAAEISAMRTGDRQRGEMVAKAIVAHVAEVGSISTLYVSLGKQVYEILLARIFDMVEGEQLGVLALCLPFELPPPFDLEDGEHLEIGLRIGTVLHGTSLAPRACASAEMAIAAMGEASDIEFTAANDSYIAYVRTVVEEPRADLVAIASLTPITTAVRSLLSRVSVAVAITIAVGLVAAFMMARTLSRPIAEMSAAAGAIEKGDYGVRVPVRDRSELGELAERFNAMGAGLALRDQYRRVLDVVADPEIARELLAGKIDLGGRSQEVGVLFCDIRGFTAQSEAMEPPAVIALLNDHMTLMTKSAYAHGGVVDKFVGDMIMVTFGVPKAAPDDASRLVQCARAMITERARANIGSQNPIEIGIGCTYGTVIAGCMGSKQRLDYTVIGTPVNLAARLCARAPAMRVYIDRESQMRNSTLTCVPLDPFEAKGFRDRIQAFELQPPDPGPKAHT